MFETVKFPAKAIFKHFDKLYNTPLQAYYTADNIRYCEEDSNYSLHMLYALESLSHTKYDATFENIKQCVETDLLYGILLYENNNVYNVFLEAILDPEFILSKLTDKNYIVAFYGNIETYSEYYYEKLRYNYTKLFRSITIHKLSYNNLPRIKDSIPISIAGIVSARISMLPIKIIQPYSIYSYKNHYYPAYSMYVYEISSHPCCRFLCGAPLTSNFSKCLWLDKLLNYNNNKIIYIHGEENTIKDFSSYTLALMKIGWEKLKTTYEMKQGEEVNEDL